MVVHKSKRDGTISEINVLVTLTSVSLENIGPHRVCFYPQPTPSYRNPNENRPVEFSKNPIGSASKNISRKVSSYSKMSSLARVAWVSGYT
ncbi:hypothetical protein GCK72_013081 [Caenorhabditis remanei]|uniref:Uncharacterized protein n=1 Tax=Caenorhabditis remanei TaxID=31234 RepID=A0A6A5GMT1_CAERE|nr:hypothetical protein GCK72_013081 [Caenorhabditis remanei]KAF1756627.1 hypothetical protein GCK72_013081 [Caenorhabditis remanei]